MRFSSSVMTALLIAATAMAQSSDSAKAKAQAALSLSQIKRERTAAASACDAKCKASLALAARQRERGACLDDVGAAMDLAAKDGKLLFIWVGMTCHDEPALRAEFPNAVHCHADKVNDNGSPRLLVGPLPDGTFQPVPRGKIDAKTPAAIRGLMKAATPVPVSMTPVMRAALNC